MKKWKFWLAMLLVLLANGTFFFAASLSAMRRGISGADNQAALMFIPLLWAAAALVLPALGLGTLISGRNIEKTQVIRLPDALRLGSLPPRERAGAAVFFVSAGLLMLFAFWLFAAQPLLSAAYALTGGLALLFLRAWKKAPRDLAE